LSHAKRLLLPSMARSCSSSKGHDEKESKLQNEAKVDDQNSELDKILRELYNDQPKTAAHHQMSGVMSSKFDVYKDEDSPVIYDIDEERELKLMRQLEKEQEEEAEADDVIDIEKEEENVPTIDPKFAQFNLKPGVNGVFDVEDLVEVLRAEKCSEVVVLAVPKELNYVDHMVIVTCKSPRHLRASATFVRKLFKLKRRKCKHRIPEIEGFKDKSASWLAMDMDNIALHLFLAQARRHYDVESLWAVGHDGSEGDMEEGGVAAELGAAADDSVAEMDQLFKQSHELLADLEPATTPSRERR